jgi:hypothetical protein
VGAAGPAVAPGLLALGAADAAISLRRGRTTLSTPAGTALSTLAGTALSTLAGTALSTPAGTGLG